MELRIQILPDLEISAVPFISTARQMKKKYNAEDWKDLALDHCYFYYL